MIGFRNDTIQNSNSKERLFFQLIINLLLFFKMKSKESKSTFEMLSEYEMLKIAGGTDLTKKTIVIDGVTYYFWT